MPEPSHAVLAEPLVQVDHLLREVALALAPEREPAPPARTRPRPSEPAPVTAGEPAPVTGRETASVTGRETASVTGREPAPVTGRAGPLAEMLERARHEPPEPEPEPKPAKSHCCHPDVSGELSELADLRSTLEALRTSLGELLQGYRGALVQALAASAPPLAVPAPARSNEFTLVAGPFVALDAVRAFEQMLLALPGIDQVAIRGYEGADRAIVDVRLAAPNS